MYFVCLSLSSFSLLFVVFGPFFFFLCCCRYALRLCHQENKKLACVSIYTSMGLYEVGRETEKGSGETERDIATKRKRRWRASTWEDGGSIVVCSCVELCVGCQEVSQSVSRSVRCFVNSLPDHHPANLYVCFCMFLYVSLFISSFFAFFLSHTSI